MFTILRNHFYTLRRKQKREVEDADGALTERMSVKPAHDGQLALDEFKEAFAEAERLMEEHQVPVVLEFILERVTNISMGTEVDQINEFEEILCLDENLTAEKGWVSEKIHSDEQLES